jgi:ankyrin repeat protein
VMLKKYIYLLTREENMTWTRLHDACQRQDNTLVVMLSHRSSEEASMVDENGSTPLHLVC